MFDIPVLTIGELEAAYTANNAEIKNARLIGDNSRADALIVRNDDISRYIDALAPEVAA